MIRYYHYPFGAQYTGDQTRFSLWAPGADSVSLLLEKPEGDGERAIDLERESDGFYSGQIPEAGAGTRYRYLINGQHRVPDPASRYQPEDVHGPSEVMDPRAYNWRNESWRGIDWEECVLYELHLGTFTPEGDLAAAARKLPHLEKTGITAVELMPVSDFSGSRNWGYDGVLPFAPDSSYGTPDDLKRFVDEAHGRGIAVFLDVVYNHFGPDGNYLWLYAPQFFTQEVSTPWGDAIDFRRREVRDLFINNALYWIEEFYIDGLRFDAVHAIHDPSEEHILNEIARTVRTNIAEDRRVHLVLENDRNEAHFLNPDSIDGFTAQWNDDFHHIMHTIATGESGGYYADFAADNRRLLVRSLAEGFAFQGDPSSFRGGESRGEPSAGLPPTAFVNFIQNHDQVGNRAFGERLAELCEPSLLEALVCIQFLSPHVPLLFMGEEWGAVTPFQYFCDFHDELAESVREGRRREFASFPQFRDPSARSRIPDPNDISTFERSRLDWRGAETGAGEARLHLYRTLIAVRREQLAGRMRGASVAARVSKPPYDSALVSFRLGDGGF
ncbi:malto-oligosyltrehalose trehalohydrolase, partial [Salinispira pacifica]